jgi:type II secretory ATPase GspE/PulE/Tfp pilus assembly ATPase PilB-like protein
LEIEALVADYLHAFGEARNRPAAAALVGQWTQRFGRSRQDLSAHDPSGQGLLVHHESPGCDKCAGTGYRGRAGIHELLQTTRELRQMIQTGTRTDDIQKAAVESGMRTLRQDGIEKVLSGVTSILEVRATTSG